MDTLEQAKKILREYDGRKCRIMEVCGTHTHEIFRLGIRQLLSEKIQLISGPGCPVCVTPVSFIDEAIWLAEEKQCMICTFGDLVRVPGSRSSLQLSRGRGSDIRVVYSPLDAVELAAAHPEKQVVFLSVGFETTTPASCLAVQQAKTQGLHNFSLLTANKTMPGAIEAMAGATDLFLYPGHVLAITGTSYYEALAHARHQRCLCRIYGARAADGTGHCGDGICEASGSGGQCLRCREAGLLPKLLSPRGDC